MSGGNVTSIDVPRGLPSGKHWFDAERAKALAEVRFWPHPFSSVSQMCTALSLPESKFQGWRLVAYELGFIDGLPELCGRAVATDGIILLLWNGSSVIRGHREGFVHLDNLPEDWISPSKLDGEGKVKEVKERKPRQPKRTYL